MAATAQLDLGALRVARRSAGLTQAELAQRVGVERSRISVWERGRAGVHARHLRALAVALQVPPSVLLAPDSEAGALRTMRLAAGLSIAELAARSGVSGTTLQRWEVGSVGARAAKAADQAVPALAAALGVSEDRVRQALRCGGLAFALPG